MNCIGNFRYAYLVRYFVTDVQVLICRKIMSKQLFNLSSRALTLS